MNGHKSKKINRITARQAMITKQKTTEVKNCKVQNSYENQTPKMSDSSRSKERGTGKRGFLIRLAPKLVDESTNRRLIGSISLTQYHSIN